MKRLLIIINMLMLFACKDDKVKDTVIQDTRSKPLQDKYKSFDSEKNDLQKRFDAALSRIDTLTLNNPDLEAKHDELFSKLRKRKNEIHRILLIEKLTTEEKQTVGNLITEMDDTLNNLKK